MPNLHLYDMLGNYLGHRIRPCAELYSAAADLLADRFGVEVDLIAFDNRADGATYITVDGDVRGYALTIDWDGGWHEAIPAGVPDRTPVHRHSIANDNTDQLSPALAGLARALEEV